MDHTASQLDSGYLWQVAEETVQAYFKGTFVDNAAGNAPSHQALWEQSAVPNHPERRVLALKTGAPRRAQAVAQSQSVRP